MEGLATSDSCGWAGNFLLMAKLRKKIMGFRDILELPPSNGLIPMNELLMGMVEDLQKLYPNSILCPSLSQTNMTSIFQGLCHFYEALKSVGDSCVKTRKWRKNLSDKDYDIENISWEKLIERVLETLDYMSMEAKEIFDVMEDKGQTKGDTPENLDDSTFSDFSKDHQSDNKSSYCDSPHTPTSVLSETTHCLLDIGEFTNLAYSPPLFMPLRLQAVSKLKPIDVEHHAFHMFPHVSVQKSIILHQIDKGLKDSEPEKQVAKSNSEALKVEATNASETSLTGVNEDLIDCRAKDETPEILKLISRKLNGKKGSGVNGSTPSKLSELLLPPPPTPPMLPPLTPSLWTKGPLLPTPPTPPPVLQKGPLPPTSPMPLPKETAPPTPHTPLLKRSAPPTPLLKGSAPPPPPMPLPKGSTSPTPSLPLLKGSAPSPPMPLPKGSAPPPPPPVAVMKALRPKKVNTKLKRSAQMGSLYRLLKGKVEGSSLDGRSSHGRKNQTRGLVGNKAQGMADALAEMTKRSAYFRQIEEDIEKFATLIMEMKSSIDSFQTRNMDELLKFHQYVELHLEDLTDETQVLMRFGDFPSKKLETIRMAATMYTRLDAIVTNLDSWKVVPPLARQLERVECYFNKIKVEVDAIERNKDEESKRFQSHNIDFDFNILVRIKEAMVDVSSNCIEMALQESKEMKVASEGERETKLNDQSKAFSQMLWRAFQLAFRVYNFAGGQDDRADRLTSELAQEIETYSHT